MVVVMTCGLAVAETVPLATALDTPGREWSVTANQYSVSPYGIPDAGAIGGSLVVMGYGTEIHTVVSGPRLMKIRYRGQAPMVFFDGNYSSDAGHPLDPAPAGWFDGIWSLPTGETSLTLWGAITEIDRVEFIAPPATLAAALGLAEGSISTGGADPWTIAPYAELSGYGARIEAFRGHADSSLEMPVQGPAEVIFYWKSENYNNGFAVLVDGKITDVMDGSATSGRTMIEIPAGPHTVRWVARPPKASDPWDSFKALLAGIEIVALPQGGRALAALDYQGAVSVPAAWTASAAFSRDGGLALQAPAVDPLSSQWYADYQIRTSFDGPGVLSFWWYAGTPANDDGLASWYFRNLTTGDNLLSRWPINGVGWRQETLWVPPGGALFEWSVHGTTKEVALTALDGVQFTPSTAVTLGEALGAPDLDWINDPAHPWTGVAGPGLEGSMALSPPLVYGESAHIRTVVTGPGKISFRWKDLGAGRGNGEFWIDGQRRNESRWQDDNLVEFQLPGYLPVTLEWSITAWEWAEQPNEWVGVRDVSWDPSPAYPLGEALDAPAMVTWKTSPGIPFIGRDNEGAVNGTAAYVALKPGEESWLEATVNGPGLFDFWLRDAAGMHLPEYLWNYWSLTIDGKPVAIGGTSWPAQWITGNGAHRIRLTFRHPAESGLEWIACAVDAVSWIPLTKTTLAKASGLNRNLWWTGNQNQAEGFTSIGRNGGPAVLLRAPAGKTCWVATMVTGPCELSWDSALGENGWADRPLYSLEIDGVKTVPFDSHSWQRMRLTLPKGVHLVRWTCETPVPAEVSPPLVSPVAFDAVWRIGAVCVVRGITPLAQALDAPALFALESGDQGGCLVNAGPDDAWQPGPQTSLWFFDLTKTGKLTVRWGRPDAPCYGWTQQNAGWYQQQLWSDQPGWHDHISALYPGGFSRWTYAPEEGWDTPANPPLLLSLTFDARSAKTLENAIESPRALAPNGWFGISDRLARTGNDCAWSLLSRPGESHPVTLTLTGPARLSCWWKRTGPGTLRMSLDGGILPVPEPGAVWSKIEFAINPGTHVIEWTHTADAQTGDSTPGEAWLDGLQISRSTARSMAQAAALDPGLVLTSTSDTPEHLPWQPVSYREKDGTWAESVRAVSGSRLLRAMVTGPMVLEFRGRCFTGYPVTPQPHVRTSSSVNSVIVIGGGGMDPVPIGHFLAVEVGGNEELRIDANAMGAWQDGAVRVPEGQHEVTFRLMTRYRLSWWETITDSSISDLQGWVDDVRLISPSNRYAAWARAKNLPQPLAGPTADADGDGVSNFMEYTFGTDPLDRTSCPPPLKIAWSASRARAPSNSLLQIPYLPSPASGTLQSSPDLIHWVTEPTPLLRYQPLASWWWVDINGNPSSYDTSSYHTITLPADIPQRFYRISITE